MSAASVASQSTPDSVARLIDLRQLTRLDPGVTCRQFASTDPSGRGHDHGHYLRKNGDRFVLAEMDGPGVIVRLWSANAAGKLLVTLDGEPQPRLACAFQELFAGKVAPFCEPIATRRSGGFISYFPIPYAKSCRVEVSELGKPEDLYYHVQYLTYPKGTAMRTFTRELPASEQVALASVLARWSKPDPLAALAHRKQPEVAWIGPGQLRDLLHVPGPGRVELLALGIDPSTIAPRALVLEVYYDGAAEPSICAPVPDFFGLGFGVRPFASLPIGWSEAWDQGYCSFEMPYRQRIRILVRNRDEKYNAGIRYEVKRALAEDLMAEDRAGAGGTTSAGSAASAGSAGRVLGYLHAEFRSEEGYRSGTPANQGLYELARIQGPAKLVGITQALQGVGDLWYLEGNERFTIDAESQPSIVGTGTEDFYNGGWYWDQGCFALPLHGLNQKEEWTTNRTMPFRFFVPDAISCARSLRAEIEHGSANQVKDAYYSSVVYWYGARSNVRRPKTEELRIPRLWVSMPKGFLAASSLAWRGEGKIELMSWEELTTTHRGLDRPLHQAFPVSDVDKDGLARDARVVLLGREYVARSYRATFSAPHADQFRMAFRVLGGTQAEQVLVKIDGKVLGRLDPRATKIAPLAPQVLGPVGLAAGDHELELIVPPGVGTFGIDAFELRPASPFVRRWRVAPPVDAEPKGTVEDSTEIEKRCLARDFDPAQAGWKDVEVKTDHIDLNQHVARRAPIFGYLACEIELPDGAPARAAKVLLGSDDGVRVWVNGELAWSNPIHRHLTPDADRFDIKLLPGRNRIVVKVKNDDGGYALALRIADPEGVLRIR